MSIKIAVIGTGHLGSIHAKLLKSGANAILCGIYDPDQVRSERLATELWTHSFKTIDNAFKNSDAVIIASPTIHHFQIAKQALESGKHCFIEKPITTTHEEALELIKIAETKNLIIQVGHVERFNPSLLALKDYTIAPLFIEAHRLSQFKPRATDVSVVLDLMIHDIDIVLWLVNSPVKSIDANGVAVLTETPDIANARITFENGCVANLTASRISAQSMRKMRLFQKNAYISMDFGNSSVEVFRLVDEDESLKESTVPAMMLGNLEAGRTKKSIIFEKPSVPPVNAIAEEQKSFADAILLKTPVAVTAREAAEALRVAEEIMKCTMGR